MITPADILKGKILIVDDQEANVTLLEQMLRARGYVSIGSTRDPFEVCDLHAKLITTSSSSISRCRERTGSR